MAEVFISGNCPNCGKSFIIESSFGNLRKCKACKQWSIILNGQISEKVIYKIIPFQEDRKNFEKALIHVINDSYEKDTYKELGDILIKSFYLPVREIGSGLERRIIAANNQYEELHTRFFPHVQDSKFITCDDYDSILLIELQKDFSEDIFRDKNAIILDIDKNRNEQDKTYELFRKDFYKIIYLPIFEISFTGGNEKWFCLGLKDQPGLKESVTHIRQDSSERKYGCFAYSLIGFIILCGLKQCSDISSEGFGVFEYPIHLLLQLIWGLLKGIAISLLFVGVYFLWSIWKEKTRENDIAKKIK